MRYNLHTIQAKDRDIIFDSRKKVNLRSGLSSKHNYQHVLSLHNNKSYIFYKYSQVNWSEDPQTLETQI